MLKCFHSYRKIKSNALCLAPSTGRSLNVNRKCSHACPLKRKQLFEHRHMYNREVIFNDAVLPLLLRTDRARWIVALREHKQADVSTPTASKSACYIYQGNLFQIHLMWMKLTFHVVHSRRFTVIVFLKWACNYFRCNWNIYQAVSSFPGVKIFPWSIWTLTLGLQWLKFFALVSKWCILVHHSLPVNSCGPVWSYMCLTCSGHAYYKCSNKRDEVELQITVY